MSHFVSHEFIRSRFSTLMSTMYKEEVPLYGDLLELVNATNNDVLDKHPDVLAQLTQTGELSRLHMERHGAIRLGKPYELFTMRRLFAVMGMYPVGYYDLATAGVPVHATAFRALDDVALNQSPFRVFTSLLRLDLITDDVLRGHVEDILENRQIFTDTALALVDKWETQGGLSEADAEVFVHEALETFRWHDSSTVSREMYDSLLNQHRLIADVVAFRGPHINHLTPRTLDIDVAQETMEAQGIPAKEVIEGPPRRKCPILLRQTSFKALTESVTFTGDDGRAQTGEHKARFGEIEQRGAGVTQKGQDLYDKLLNETRAIMGGAPTGDNREEYYRVLEKKFQAFPDDYHEMQRQELAYFYYYTTDKKLPESMVASVDNVNELLDGGYLTIEPMVYEDFLPVSAAGIFASNLGNDDTKEYTETSNQKLFEKDLGQPVNTLMAWYDERQDASIEKCLSELNALR